MLSVWNMKHDYIARIIRGILQKSVSGFFGMDKLSREVESTYKTVKRLTVALEKGGYLKITIVETKYRKTYHLITTKKGRDLLHQWLMGEYAKIKMEKVMQHES